MGNDYDFPYGGFLKVIDIGCVVFECDKVEGDTLDTLFQKAETLLRASNDFDRAIRDVLEAKYRTLCL